MDEFYSWNTLSGARDLEEYEALRDIIVNQYRAKSWFEQAKQTIISQMLGGGGAEKNFRDTFDKRENVMSQEAKEFENKIRTEGNIREKLFNQGRYEDIIIAMVDSRFYLQQFDDIISKSVWGFSLQTWKTFTDLMLKVSQAVIQLEDSLLETPDYSKLIEVLQSIKDIKPGDTYIQNTDKLNQKIQELQLKQKKTKLNENKSDTARKKMRLLSMEFEGTGIKAKIDLATKLEKHILAVATTPQLKQEYKSGIHLIQKQGNEYSLVLFDPGSMYSNKNPNSSTLTTKGTLELQGFLGFCDQEVENSAHELEAIPLLTQTHKEVGISLISGLWAQKFYTHRAS